MNCKDAKGGARVCKIGNRTVVFHDKSNKTAKAARGRALHRKYACERSKRTGQFTSCHPRGKKK